MNPKRTSLNSVVPVLTGIFLLLIAACSQAADGTWINTAGGTWSTPGNWSGGIVADGAGNVANTAFFNTLDLTADTTVTVDAFRTNGNLVFGDANTGTAANWIVSGSPLLLSGPTPTITVGSLGATNKVTISSVLLGTNGFAPNGLKVTGNGRVDLGGANNFTNLLVDGSTLGVNVAQSPGVNVVSNTVTLTNGAAVQIVANTTWNQTLLIKGSNAFLRTPGVAAGGNWNGMFIGDGTLYMNLAGVQMTFGGNNAWNSNLFANFTGTIVLDGGGNFRFDPNNAATVTFGSKFATFDLGQSTNTMNERGATAIAQHTTFIGALRGGPGTAMACNGNANVTNTFQIGDANLTTAFDGRINNGAANAYTSVTKSGTGTLTLSGSNNYSGVTIVQGGKLVLTTTASISNSPVIKAVSPGVFDVSAFGSWQNSLSQGSFQGNGTITGAVELANTTISPGIALGDTATLGFGPGLTLSNAVTRHDTVAPSAVDRIFVNGDLNLLSTNIVQLVPTLGNVIVTNGNYVLFEWTGSLNGDWASSLILSYPPQLGTLTLTTNTSKQIVLAVSGASLVNLTWRGDQGSDWTAALNWRDTNGAAATWADGRIANFDDSAVTATVNLAANVSPARVLISNATDYAFNTTGGKITGAGNLIKTGSGKVTFAANNDYSGSTALNEGTLQLGNGGTAGSAGSGVLVNNGAVVFNRSDDLTFAAAISGSGQVRQNGPGKLIFTANNTYTGNTIVSNGVTLQLGDGNFNGSVVGNVIVTNGATLHYLVNNLGGITAENGIEGDGTVIYQINPGGSPRTILVGNTATNTYFTGNVIVRPATRLEIATTNGMLGTNITAEYDGGSGIPSSFYAHAGATFTNTQSISIIGQGPGTGVDQPRGFGALRLNNVWTGPITIAGVDLNFLNTTIGGASGTGTILGNISDGGNSYMLEYFGGTIQVGPTTGVNTYGVTRISEALTGGAPGTSGNTIVVALNNNAFSTNNLEMVGQATLRVNGNNIAFPTVTIPYAGVTNFVPVIQNNSTNSAGTITLGGDGSSWQFDGVFGDGTGQPLNLTKVGSGTLTLSGDSTNTGTVAVNQGVLALIEADAPAPAAPKHGYGTFSNATLITVASGATLDVTARPAGTLSLNSGQTLGGNGTLSGTVDALAGSAVAPGSSVGTLTISGGLTLNGTLLMELNRTNGLQTNDLITVSGSFTSTGGALFVTNTGPALAAGNFFQLFGGGRSFASVTLQTNDAANNKTYVWNNTVASNGRITVQNVGTFVNPAPTNITFKVNGPNLELSWPADHTGWRLQAQTNSRTAGVKTNWADVQGSTLVNSVTNAIDKNNGTVFYRMVYP